VAVRTLLPEPPYKLPVVVVKLHHSPEIPVLRHRPRNREVRTSRIPLALLHHHIRVHDQRILVLVVLHQLNLPRLVSEYQS
jgi:hypothetical protein